MQGHQVGFESSLQQHLDAEQRRAVLEAIGGSINPDSTLGEIIDAAEALGWSEKMGDLSLADLAEALLAPSGEAAAGAVKAGEGEDAAEGEELAADDEDEDLDEDYEDEDLDEDEDDEELDEDEDEDDEDFELAVQEPAPSRRKAAKAAPAKGKAAASKKAGKKVASKAGKKVAEPEPMRGKKKTGKKVAGKAGKKVAEAPARGGRGADRAASSATAKKSAKKAGKRKIAAVDVDERMSLEDAAEFFLPVVDDLGEATMQALEEQTGVSRRKLRFHVGQLVKHGYLERHGMGRGTYYTRR